MIASVILFVVYVAAGVAFAVWGIRAGGKKTVLYPIIEGVLSVLGIAAALILYFSFGRLPGRAIENADYLEWAAEAYSVYATAVAIVWAVVALIGGLRLLIRLAEKEEPGVWGSVLDLAAPFIGAAVIFLAAIAARALFSDLSSLIGFEISAFALAAAFGLRFLLALTALIGRKEGKKQGYEHEENIS